MTDSHAHLTISPIDSVLETELKKFTENGGKYILNASFDIESMYGVVKQAQKLNKLFGNTLVTAIGIHPEEFNNVKDHDETRKVMDRYEKFLSDNINNIMFIGETGLDYYVMFNPEPTDKTINTELAVEMQKMAFARHVELAIKHDLPLTIHSREQRNQTKCISETIKVICDHGKGKVRGCMHSYTGEISFVNDILDLGLFIGFNAIITYKSAENVRDILRKVPLDKILLETDAPLLPIRNTGAKYGKPSDILEIAKVVAEVKGSNVDEVLRITDDNFAQLLK